MIVLVANFKAKQGKEKELEELLLGMVPKVQAEEGTLMYTLHKAKKDEGQFLFYEQYKDKEAFDFHRKTPYFQEFAGKLADLLEGNAKLETFEDIASINR